LTRLIPAQGIPDLIQRRQASFEVGIFRLDKSNRYLSLSKIKQEAAKIMTKDEVNILIDFVVLLSKKGNKVKPPSKDE